jgi:hypothetical protein
MLPKKVSAPGAAALQPLDTNQETLSLSERLEARREKPLVQHSRRRSWTKRLETWRSSINKYKGRRRRWSGWPIFKGRSTKLLKKCVILFKMNKTEGPSTGSFVKRAYSTKMDGMMISVMILLLLMMLLSQTLEKLLQKMDEYIRDDNDFRQRREEAYIFSEMTRGFGGRIHPRHVRSIHSSSQNDDKGSQPQRSQYTSQSSGQQQSSFRPPTPRGRGARGFGERFGDQPRKIYCLFYGEDKGHTTRMCQITIQKQKEIAEAEAR